MSLTKRQTYVIARAWSLGCSSGTGGTLEDWNIANMTPSERRLAQSAFVASREAMLKFTEHFEATIREVAMLNEGAGASPCRYPGCHCRAVRHGDIHED